MGKHAGCRKVADTFNRLHTPTSVGKSFVNDTIRNHQYALLHVSRELRDKRPSPVAINSAWGVDLTLARDRLDAPRPVLRMWAEPAIFERVRVPGANIRVIAPRARQMRGAPFATGIDWLPMEEHFTFYGGAISFMQPGASLDPLVGVNPWRPVHGPFSASFKWVTLDDWPHGPIRCTDGQAAVFKALWSVSGTKVSGERVMTRAGQKSDKPNDLFKVKAENKGKLGYEGPLHAYRSLVKSTQRPGEYWLPCAVQQAELMHCPSKSAGELQKSTHA